MATLDMLQYSTLVDKFAIKGESNRAIVALVGAINASDLAKATLKPEAKAALIKGLEHSNAKVRWWCLQLMDHLADAPFIPSILPIVNDPVAKVRKHAVHALTCDACKPGKCGLELSESVRFRVKKLFQSDPDERVRHEASLALSNWTT